MTLCNFCESFWVDARNSDNENNVCECCCVMCVYKFAGEKSVIFEKEIRIHTIWCAWVCVHIAKCTVIKLPNHRWLRQRIDEMKRVEFRLKCLTLGRIAFSSIQIAYTSCILYIDNQDENYVWSTRYVIISYFIKHRFLLLSHPYMLVKFTMWPALFNTKSKIYLHDIHLFSFMLLVIFFFFSFSLLFASLDLMRSPHFQITTKTRYAMRCCGVQCDAWLFDF